MSDRADPMSLERVGWEVSRVKDELTRVEARLGIQIGAIEAKIDQLSFLPRREYEIERDGMKSEIAELKDSMKKLMAVVVFAVLAALATGVLGAAGVFPT